MTDTVLRKIHFYRVEEQRDESGTLLSFRPSPLLNYIEDIPHGEDRKMRRTDGDYSYCWVHSSSPRQKLLISTNRMSGFPSFEQNGLLNSLPVPEEAGLAEITHVVFFDRNIVGADFNVYGPRLSRLSEYFRRMCGDLAPFPIEFKTLLEPDSSRSLNLATGIRSFTFGTRRSDIDVIKSKSEGLGRILESQAQFGESGEVTINVKQEGNKRQEIDYRYLDLARDLVVDDDIKNHAVEFRVKVVDSDNRSSPLNLLQDYLLFRRQVVKQDPRNRTIDSNSAFAAIEDVYEENKELIQRAASIEP